MSEKTKNLIVWLIILSMVVITGSVLLFTIPDFSGVERISYDLPTTTVIQASGATTTDEVSIGETLSTTKSTAASTVSTTTAKTSKTKKSTTTKTPVVFPLNINTATAQELMEIPGIGETYANRIIDHREKIGGYTSLEQLLDIKGIGEKRLQNWTQYLTV